MTDAADLDPVLLEILVCPQCHAALTPEPDGEPASCCAV